MNLILVDHAGRVELGAAAARHAREVLGARVGAELRVGVPRGGRGRGRVVEVGPAAVVLDVELDEPPPAPPWLDVVLALPRPKVLTRTLELLASFGVRRIDLTNAWRVDKSYLGSPRLDPDAIAAALRAGCEQGAHTWVPELSVHPLLVPFLEGTLGPRLAAEPRRRRLLAHPSGPGLEHAVPAGPNDVTVAVGPEGGWIAAELASFAALGFQLTAIAPAVLRVEAAVAALYGQLALWRRL
jgi:RsmE family RNA methyltransferase